MLWHGDRLVLGERSARLAETLGEPMDYAGEWIHRFIATSIIEQFDKNRTVFDAFLQEGQWKAAIGPAAEAAGMHPYTLLYGIPQHVIDAVILRNPEQLMCVIQLGDMGPHILEQLVLRNGRKPLDANKFDIHRHVGVPTTYEARAQLTQNVVGHELSYAMMTNGATLEDIMLVSPKKLAACMVWGVPPRYASTLLQRGYEPGAIADFHRNGIALEYV